MFRRWKDVDKAKAEATGYVCLEGDRLQLVVHEGNEYIIVYPSTEMAERYTPMTGRYVRLSMEQVMIMAHERDLAGAVIRCEDEMYRGYGFGEHD